MYKMSRQLLALFICMMLGTGISMAGTTDRTAVAAEKGMQRLERPFSMAFTIGPNFNTGGSEHGDVFGVRPEVCTQFDCRLGFGVARGWSVYADLGLSFYTLKVDNIGEGFANALLNALLPGYGSIHTSVAAGGAYLWQPGRFLLSPRAGIGWYHVKKGESSGRLDNGVRVEYDRRIAVPTFNAGLSVGFRTSRICTLIMDLNYRCPLARASANVTTTTGDGVTTAKKFRSGSWGNDLSLSVGVQFNVEMN